MPEIAEVYRAACTLRRAALSKRIRAVDTIEDDLVFVDGARAFKHAIVGQEVSAVERYGKHFWMTLENKVSILFHLGMSGYVHIKGETPLSYRKKPKDPTLWPPKYHRFSMTLDDGVEFAFMDSRRFGRIRILHTANPRSVPPMNKLGFDAISRMAELGEFESVVLKRKCPIKALLLNQQFLAGVGNWVADEILYQSKVHPAQVCNTLSSQQIEKLWQNTIDVCKTAVEVNADHNRFPDHWLFKYRWGKSHASRKLKAKRESTDYDSSDDGERSEQVSRNLGKTMTTKDKRVLNIEWITCGGRTSAFVVDEQLLPREVQEEANPSCTVQDISTEKKCGKRIVSVASDVDSGTTTLQRKRKKIKYSQTDDEKQEAHVAPEGDSNKRVTRAQSKR